jgi:hypothetical protein
MKRQAWIWDDKEHWVIPHLMDTILGIEDEEVAEDFFEAYSEVCDHAEPMVGYMAYLIGLKEGPEVKDDILELFMIDEKPHYIDWGFGHPANGYQYSSYGLKVE